MKFLSPPIGIVKADVGLSAVDNTSDATKNGAVATLTNKTLTGATNTLTASLLKSATTEVSISAATAPTVGQVLTASSSTAAAWISPNVVTNYTPAAGATATLDLSLARDHRITMPAGNITIALSNEASGSIFMVHITQDSIGARTVTWFAGIKWAGGTIPTLTTTANKRDTFGFVRTGVGTYDGYIVGKNI